MSNIFDKRSDDKSEEQNIKILTDPITLRASQSGERRSQPSIIHTSSWPADLINFLLLREPWSSLLICQFFLLVILSPFWSHCGSVVLISGEFPLSFPSIFLESWVLLVVSRRITPWQKSMWSVTFWWKRHTYQVDVYGVHHHPPPAAPFRYAKSVALV